MRLLALVLAALALPGAAEARTTAVGVGLREWQVGLYRQTVKPGRVKFNVTNLGEDSHDLFVRRRGKIVTSVPELRPGERFTRYVTLRRRGRYTLFCSLADHEALGMRAVLRVRGRRTPG